MSESVRDRCAERLYLCVPANARVCVRARATALACVCVCVGGG